MAAAAFTGTYFYRLRGDGKAAEHAHALPKKQSSHVSQAAVAPLDSSVLQGNPLRLPGRDGLLAEVDVVSPITLRAQQTEVALLPGKATLISAYAGTVDGRSVLNPLLRVRRGEAIDVTLVNELKEPTTIHWHGLSVDEVNDGSGLHVVEPGKQARYRLRVLNRAGLYWYHAHPHHLTGQQLQQGLAGLLLVEDDEELALRKRLNLRWGERDLPLILTDKQIDADNAIVYQLGADDWIGNHVLVNWTVQPVLDVVPGLYRLRIANFANARMFRLAFMHGDQIVPMHLIGTDGGLLSEPQTMDDCFLAPAQRIDVLVDFSHLPADATLALRSLDYAAMENENEGGALAPDPMGDHPGAARMGAPQLLMNLRVVCTSNTASKKPSSNASGLLPVGTQTAAPIPAAPLSNLPALPDTTGWPVRPFRLRMDDEGTWFINDWNFLKTGHASAFSIKRGSREIWEIRNSMTSMPHPMHIHGFSFRVLSRSLSPPDLRARAVAPGGLGPQDMGFTDTVVIWPGEQVRIAVDFSQPFRGAQRYMFHCHNLEHEDMGMMITFSVVN